jgi:hypothetical protein
VYALDAGNSPICPREQEAETPGNPAKAFLSSLSLWGISLLDFSFLYLLKKYFLKKVKNPPEALDVFL